MPRSDLIDFLIRDHLIAVSGTSYGIGASPSLASLFKDVSAEIIDPDQTNRSLLTKMYIEGAQDQSEGLNGDAVASDELHVGPLGSGSDFTVFLQHLGIASVNVGYSRKSTDPGENFFFFFSLDEPELTFS